MDSKKNRKTNNSGIHVFISYRRETSREIARNIYERLSLNGINTFFDYNSMRNGKFNEQIYDAIEQADDFILIFSKGALDRCGNPGDWVRMEIEYALKHKKNIILLCTESEISFPDNLPESLKELPLYNAITLNQEYYEASLARLIEMLSCYDRKNNGLLAKLGRFLYHHRLGAVLFVVVISILVVLFYNNIENRDAFPGISNSNKTGLVAKIYLPRYADLDREVLDNHFFSTDVLYDYEYVDTIINNEYYIYPRSAYFTNNMSTSVDVINDFTPIYHSLPLRLSIQNTKSETKIVNDAGLEILEIHPFATPIISVYQDSKGLKFVSQTHNYTPSYNLSYSILSPGESFTKFKRRELVSSSDYIIPLVKSDSLIGKIQTKKSQWIFRYSGFWKSNNLKNVIGDRVVKVSPPSSDVRVYYIDITSMEAPVFYRIPKFSRRIVPADIDENVYFIIKSEYNFDAKLRIKLTTINKNVVYTEPINIRYIKPALYENQPF